MAKTYAKVNSKNVKLRAGGKAGMTGAVPSKLRISATSRTADTCAPDCPFLEANNHPADILTGKPICYPTAKVGGGPSIFERADLSGVEDTSAALEEIEFGASKGSAVRHLVSGDVAGPNDDYVQSANALHTARPDLKGYGYTHHWRQMDPSDIQGWEMNASTETPGQAAEAIQKGWNAVIESPADQSLAGQVIAGRRVVSCPNQQNPNIGCVNCMLCAKNYPKRPIIEFAIHGATRKVGGKVMAAREAEQSAITDSGHPDGDSTDNDSRTFLGMPSMPRQAPKSIGGLVSEVRDRRESLKAGWSDGRR